MRVFDRDATASRNKIIEIVSRLDSAVDSAFEPLRHKEGANKLFYSASALADHSIIWFIVALSLYFLRPRYKKEALQAAAILFAESGFVNVIVKTIFRRQRPIHVGDRPLPLRQPLTSSFPSGHATAATCAAVLFGDVKYLKWPIRIFAATVVMSRVHVKIHHASDVIAGVGVGWVFANVAKRTVTKVFGGSN
ncbi:undecaprenyl-diphosphatase [Ferrithrix thermotolerans DSM 19514]|uniref:Undecaprenyl-diphosphatase n=1 Tax=Ferrithrix thermotolerans DSM 19514 TaxID=1121881 RepID=A0A1M4W6S5_9ACTN|nr:undecaprenyl-diphosphatase [Ferrithrix thermotolerans DSM 19514]